MLIRRIAIVVLALAVLGAGCGGSDESADTTEVGQAPTADESPASDGGQEEPVQSGLVVREGDTVEVHYIGTLDDGSVFQSSRDRGQPLTFTMGTQQVLAGFEAAVLGTTVGDVETVRLEAEDAYGERTDDAIIDVPFNPEQGDIEVGDQVFLNNGRPAIIIAITDETVTLDANHHLAGEAITFEIEVLSITRG